jgi:hypothetical protein
MHNDARRTATRNKLRKPLQGSRLIVVAHWFYLPGSSILDAFFFVFLGEQVQLYWASRRHHQKKIPLFPQRRHASCSTPLGQ